MRMRQVVRAWRQVLRLVPGVAILCLGAAVSAAAQPAEPVTGCIPISERAGRPYGCFVLGAAPVGPLTPSAAFWHLETFPTAAAASQATGARGAVFEAFDKVWLLTIAESGWRSRGGTHEAEIGPLPIASGVGYTATYMEATFTPGMKARTHLHSGPEAWYTLSGEMCLETPSGAMVGRAGGPPVIVPAGPPMELTATGSVVRRALVLILHDSTQPPTTLVSDWTPKGLCKG